MKQYNMSYSLILGFHKYKIYKKEITSKEPWVYSVDIFKIASSADALSERFVANIFNTGDYFLRLWVRMFG